LSLFSRLVRLRRLSRDAERETRNELSAPSKSGRNRCAEQSRSISHGLLGLCGLARNRCWAKGRARHVRESPEQRVCGTAHDRESGHLKVRGVMGECHPGLQDLHNQLRGRLHVLGAVERRRKVCWWHGEAREVSQVRKAKRSQIQTRARQIGGQAEAFGQGHFVQRLGRQFFGSQAFQHYAVEKVIALLQVFGTRRRGLSLPSLRGGRRGTFPHPRLSFLLGWGQARLCLCSLEQPKQPPAISRRRSPAKVEVRVFVFELFCVAHPPLCFAFLLPLHNLHQFRMQSQTPGCVIKSCLPSRVRDEPKSHAKLPKQHPKAGQDFVRRFLGLANCHFGGSVLCGSVWSLKKRLWETKTRATCVQESGAGGQRFHLRLGAGT
jgi:hypothetical protein